MMPLALFVSLLFVYSLFSRRVERTAITAPIVFTAAGMLMFRALKGIVSTGLTSAVFLGLAEVGLVMLLFTDASRTDLNFLRSIRNLPARLLSTGLLLTILLGAVAAHLVFPQLSFWEAGILAAILAPTDAGLGQIIVNSPRVPMRIRQALNVEAGLNDGLSIPFSFSSSPSRRPGQLRVTSPTCRGSSWNSWELAPLLASRLASVVVGCWPSRVGRVGWRKRSSRSAWSRCRCSAWRSPRCLARVCSSRLLSPA